MLLIKKSEKPCRERTYQVNISKSLAALTGISKILPSRRFISSVITLSQCPITIPDCRLNSRIPRFNWPFYQSYDAPDKSTTRPGVGITFKKPDRIELDEPIKSIRSGYADPWTRQDFRYGRKNLHKFKIFSSIPASAHIVKKANIAEIACV